MNENKRNKWMDKNAFAEQTATLYLVMRKSQRLIRLFTAQMDSANLPAIRALILCKNHALATSFTVQKPTSIIKKKYLVP